MKKRLKSLLALCMAGIMMFAMTTGIASADETQTTSKIYTYDKIDSNTAYYPGDIVTPENTNSSSGCKEFFVVKYYEINKLEDTDAYRTVLYDNVVKKNFMTDDEFDQLDGVYRYWDLKDDAGKSVWPQYTVLCDYTEGTWSVVTNPTKQMTERADDYSFYEYDPRISEYNPETSNENPVCNAFYSFAYGDSETNLYGSRALELPSVDKLFGEGYEFGYHYSLNKKRSVAWNVSGEYSDNTPSGITLVNPTEEGKLIDIIYGRKTQTEEPQTEQGGKPISTYSYSTIKDALLIEPVANKYTVNFNANGGEGKVDAQSFTYDDKKQSLNENEFTRNGYTFTGWNTKADGTGTSYSDKAEVQNLTEKANDEVILYAQWDKAAATATGDDTNTMLPIALLMLSSMGIACIALNRKKHG